MRLTRRRYNYLILLAICMLSGCSYDSLSPQNQFLVNSNVESGTTGPTGWWYNAGVSGSCLATWSDTEAFSEKKSLELSVLSLNTTDFAYWAQTITTNLPLGKSQTLRAKIKSNLIGTGAAIDVRTDNSTAAIFAAQFVTSQSSTPITGTFNWREFSITLNKVNADTKSITVYLVVLPNTTGTIYFDDITLTD